MIKQLAKTETIKVSAYDYDKTKVMISLKDVLEITVTQKNIRINHRISVFRTNCEIE